MDDKKLRKMFSDKSFLKSNDFAAVASKVMTFVRENRSLVIAAVAVLAVIGVSIPGVNWYRLNQAKAFSEKLYEADQSLKKQESYQELLTEYESLPASQVARIKLVDYLLDHDDKDEAFKVIDEGLKNNETGIFSTLLILKKVDLLKEKGDFKGAATFAKENENKVIETFQGNYVLMLANMYVLADDKAQAKQLYQSLVSEAETTNSEVKKYSSTVVQKAKDRLLLIDLGVL